MKEAASYQPPAPSSGSKLEAGTIHQPLSTNHWHPGSRTAQRDVARLLNGVGQAALMRGAHPSQAARHDLARFGHELPQQPHVLVIDAVDLLDAELANLLAAEEFPSAFALSSRPVPGRPARRGPRGPSGRDPPSGRGLLPPSAAAPLTGAAVFVVSSAMILPRALYHPNHNLFVILSGARRQPSAVEGPLWPQRPYPG